MVKILEPNSVARILARPASKISQQQTLQVPDSPRSKANAALEVAFPGLQRLQG